MGERWGSSPQTLAKGPSALWTPIRGIGTGSKARRATGAPRLRGSRRTTGAPRRGTCEALPIRHGFRRDTFPAGEGGWVGRARAGLPYSRPASLMLARSAIGARGGDLLRRPTEVTAAPPAMGGGRGLAGVPGQYKKIQHPWEVIPADAVGFGDDLLARFRGVGSTCRFHCGRTAAGRGAFPTGEGGRAQRGRMRSFPWRCANLPFPLRLQASARKRTPFFFSLLIFCSVASGLPRHPCAGANAAPATKARGITP